jgi:hypothetical protein
MIEKIEKYLARPYDYYQGFRLFVAAGGDGFMAMIFEKSDDSYNQKTLLVELGKLLEVLKETAKSGFADYPEKLKSELDRAKSLMGERSDLKSRLRESHRRDESRLAREGLVWRIFEIKSELDSIYGVENYYKKMNELPDEQLIDLADDRELINRRNVVRSYMSKYKNKPEKADKYSMYGAELFAIEQKLSLKDVV